MPDWTSSMQQTFEYYRVDPGTWKDVEKLNNIKSSSITRDADTETLESATIDITESVGECYIRVYLITIQNGLKEKHPLGTFLVQTPSSSFNGKIRNVSMDAYSPLLELKEKKPPLGYSILKNESIMDNAYRITRENVTAPVISNKPTEIIGRNLLASSYLKSGTTKELVLSTWASIIITHDNLVKMIEEGQTYTFSYDAELIARTDCPTIYNNAYGFIFYSSKQAKSYDSFYGSPKITNIGDKSSNVFTFTAKSKVPGTSPNYPDDMCVLVHTHRYTTNGGSPVGHDTIRFSNLKIEKGDKATKWSPAPEDSILADPPDDPLYTDFVSNTDDTWLTFLIDLVANAKYEFSLDEMGRVLFSPKQDTASLQPVWTYDDSNSSILYPELNMDHDLYGIPNVVEVIYSNGSNNYYAKVVNDDVNSPISTVNRGREILYRVTDPDLAGTPTNNQVQEYAENLLKELSCLEYSITYTHAYCPVKIGDCIRLNYSRAGLTDIKAKVVSQTIKCEPGCPVTEKAVFTTKLWG